MQLTHNFYLCSLFAAIFAYLSSNSHSPALNFVSRRLRSALLPSVSFEAHELRAGWGSPHRDVSVPTPISGIEAEEHYKRIKKRSVEGGYASNNAFGIVTPTTTSVWFITTFATVSWSSIPSNVSRISLKLYRGSAWGTSYFDDIVSLLPRGTVSYKWTIPATSNSTGTSLLGDYLYQVLVIGYDDSGIAMVNERSTFFRIGGIQISGIAGGNLISDSIMRTAGNSYMVSYDSWSWGELSSITISLRDGYFYYMTIAQDVSNANHTFQWNIPDLLDASTNYRMVLSATTSPKDASAGSNPGQTVTASIAAPVFQKYPPANPQGFSFKSIDPNTVWNAGVNQTVSASLGLETNTRYSLTLYNVDFQSQFRSGLLWAGSVSIESVSLMLPAKLTSGKYVLIAKRSDGAVTIVSAVFTIVGLGDSRELAAATSFKVLKPASRSKLFKGNAGAVSFSVSNMALKYVNVTLHLASSDTGTPSCSSDSEVYQIASFVKPYLGQVSFSVNEAWLTSAAYHVSVKARFHDAYYYATPAAQYTSPSACSGYFFIQGSDETVPSSDDNADTSTSRDVRAASLNAWIWLTIVVSSALAVFSF